MSTSTSMPSGHCLTRQRGLFEESGDLDSEGSARRKGYLREEQVGIAHSHATTCHDGDDSIRMLRVGESGWRAFVDQIRNPEAAAPVSSDGGVPRVSIGEATIPITTRLGESPRLLFPNGRTTKES